MKILFPLLSLLLTACISSPSPTSSYAKLDADYAAFGNEPAWRLNMSHTKIIYIGDYGETEITLDKPDVQVTPNGRRYETKALTINIVHSPCNDSSVEPRYSDIVKIQIDGRELWGCGGKVLPPKTLIQSQ